LLDELAAIEIEILEEVQELKEVLSIPETKGASKYAK